MSLLFDQFDDAPAQVQMTGVFDVDSGMGGILDTLTRPSGSGDLLAGSMGWLRRERDDRCLSLRRSFLFAPIDPGSERSPFS